MDEWKAQGSMNIYRGETINLTSSAWGACKGNFSRHMPFDFRIRSMRVCRTSQGLSRCRPLQYGKDMVYRTPTEVSTSLEYHTDWKVADLAAANESLARLLVGCPR